MPRRPPPATTEPPQIDASRAVVTGATGLLAGHLLPRLAQGGTGAILALSRTRPDALPPTAEWKSADLTEEAPWTKLLNRDDVVYHLGAIVHTSETMGDSTRVFETNTMGTLRLLEAARRADVRLLVYASTAQIYGDSKRVPIREDAPGHPQTTYAASKLAGEAAVQAYQATYGLPSWIVRISNVYGPKSARESVVGRVLGQLLEGEPLAVRDYRPVRDFIHADDVAEGLMRVSTARLAPKQSVVNLGTGRAASIGQLIRTLQTVAPLCGLPRPTVHKPKTSPPTTRSWLVPSIRRLEALTRWKPRTRLRDGLLRTVNAAKTAHGQSARGERPIRQVVT